MGYLPIVVQKWVDTPLFSGQLPTLGLWMVGHQCAGMSIREDCYDIIGNDAHFAAHYFYPFLYDITIFVIVIKIKATRSRALVMAVL
jgi:hypothetical protein